MRCGLGELLQNAVDAITARRAVELGAPCAVRIDVDDEAALPRHTGLRLTEEQVHEFLAITTADQSW